VTPAPLTKADLVWALALNRAHETELSPLDRDGLAALIAAASYARGIDRAAMLIAFAPEADYASPNFLWFRARYRSFIYVDRVAVAAAARRRGLAARLYEDLFAAARAAGAERVVCEVNSDPPNPASDAFHARLGFAVVGAERLADRGKTVRYMAREL
jgi:predicted GNAT superfamily acetyltransferase